MNPKALQELIKNLRVFYRCPSCSAEYRPKDIRFLGKVDQHCFMQLNCAACSLPVLATVLLSPSPEPMRRNRRKQHAPAKATLGLDVSRKERAAFKRRGEITAEEIVDFYSYLQTYSA